MASEEEQRLRTWGQSPQDRIFERLWAREAAERGNRKGLEEQEVEDRATLAHHGYRSLDEVPPHDLRMRLLLWSRADGAIDRLMKERGRSLAALADDARQESAQIKDRIDRWNAAEARLFTAASADPPLVKMIGSPSSPNGDLKEIPYLEFAGGDRQALFNTIDSRSLDSIIGRAQPATVWYDVRVKRDDLVKLGRVSDSETQPVPQPAQRATLDQWMEDRVRTWPEGQRPPSENQDLAAAKLAYPTIKREALREVRRRLAPPHWLRPGPRKL
jgi:hypothetical protein